MKNALLGALAVLALTAAGPAAHAASSRCWVGPNGICQTNAVAAHAKWHFVHISVSALTGLWYVWDDANGIVVASGSAPAGVYRTIGGLYSRYHLRLIGALWPGGNGTIDNI
jgi:hypothetical protein